MTSPPDGAHYEARYREQRVEPTRVLFATHRGLESGRI